MKAIDYINKKEFEISGIINWHKKGYTGKGVKIANLEACNTNAWYFKKQVNDPFSNAKESLDNSHGNQTLNVISQVAPDADIYTLSSSGRYSKDSASGAFVEQSIPYMESEGIHLVNASKGGIDNRILNERIEQAQQHGVTFIASAGNEADLGPSGYARSGVWIAVGAVHLSGKGEILHANYSSIGEEVDFTQFSGLYVHDARPGYEDRVFPVQGTSFSSPMLCGMLALVQQFFLEKTGRTLTQNELYEFMKNHSIDLWEPGHDTKSGYGLFLLPENPDDIDIAKYIEKEEPQLNNPEYIIIHHSATAQGDAETFRRAHMAKGWRDVGYHYIIGNGTQSGDGQIEKGRAENESGAHCKADGMNRKSIGICLVGDLNVQRPTTAQMESLKQLCRDIMSRYRMPAGNILGHGEVKGSATACPGKNFDMKKLRGRLEVPEVKIDYKGHWAESSIQKVKNEGLMSGYPDGSFKPDQKVTRAELATALARLIERS